MILIGDGKTQEILDWTLLRLITDISAEVGMFNQKLKFKVLVSLRSCEGGRDVVGVVTPLVRGGAQVLHGDQVVQFSVLLEVHEREEEEEDGEGQIERESGRGELKDRRTCTWMT